MEAKTASKSEGHRRGVFKISPLGANMLQTATKSQHNAALPRLDASNDRLGQSARLKRGILQEAHLFHN